MVFGIAGPSCLLLLSLYASIPFGGIMFPEYVENRVELMQTAEYLPGLGIQEQWMNESQQAVVSTMMDISNIIKTYKEPPIRLKIVDQPVCTMVDAPPKNVENGEEDICRLEPMTALGLPAPIQIDESALSMDMMDYVLDLLDEALGLIEGIDHSAQMSMYSDFPTQIETFWMMDLLGQFANSNAESMDSELIVVGPPQCVPEDIPACETIGDLGTCEKQTGPGFDVDLTTAESDDGFICLHTPGLSKHMGLHEPAVLNVTSVCLCQDVMDKEAELNPQVTGLNDEFLCLTSQGLRGPPQIEHSGSQEIVPVSDKRLECHCNEGMIEELARNRHMMTVHIDFMCSLETDSKLGGISYDGLESLHDKAMEIFGENSMTVYHANNHPTLSCASTQAQYISLDVEISDNALVLANMVTEGRAIEHDLVIPKEQYVPYGIERIVEIPFAMEFAFNWLLEAALAELVFNVEIKEHETETIEDTAIGQCLVEPEMQTDPPAVEQCSIEPEQAVIPAVTEIEPEQELTPPPVEIEQSEVTASDTEEPRKPEEPQPPEIEEYGETLNPEIIEKNFTETEKNESVAEETPADKLKRQIQESLLGRFIANLPSFESFYFTYGAIVVPLIIFRILLEIDYCIGFGRIYDWITEGLWLGYEIGYTIYCVFTFLACPLCFWKRIFAAIGLKNGDENAETVATEENKNLTNEPAEEPSRAPRMVDIYDDLFEKQSGSGERFSDKKDDEYVSIYYRIPTYKSENRQ